MSYNSFYNSNNNNNNNNNNDLKNDYSIKTVIVGNKGVGKTCLFHRFAHGNFPIFIPTVFESWVQKITTQDAYNVKIALWDTVGNEEYARLRPLSYPQTDCFIMAFSISDRKSFDDCLNYWYQEIQLFLPNIPIILVGTKSDLYDDLLYNKDDLIGFNEALELKNKIQAVQYIETSSINGKNVHKVFENIVPIVINRTVIRIPYNIPHHNFTTDSSRYIINSPEDNEKDDDSIKKSSNCKIN